MKTMVNSLPQSTRPTEFAYMTIDVGNKTARKAQLLDILPWRPDVKCLREQGKEWRCK